jgi:hypothetical protein
MVKTLQTMDRSSPCSSTTSLDWDLLTYMPVASASASTKGGYTVGPTIKVSLSEMQVEVAAEASNTAVLVLSRISPSHAGIVQRIETFGQPGIEILQDQSTIIWAMTR